VLQSKEERLELFPFGMGRKHLILNKNWAFENNIIQTTDGAEYSKTRTPNVGEQ
jgi:hypothetical protein